MSEKEIANNNPQSVSTGGGAYIVNSRAEGNIAGRDMFVGNQTFTQKDSALEVKMEDLRALIQEIWQDTQQTQLNPDVSKEVEHDLNTIDKQLQKEEPAKSLVLPKLIGVIEILKASVSAGEVLQKLEPMLARAVQWVQMLIK